VRRSVRLKLSDPLGSAPGFIYLFESKGKRQPDAGQDYVQYDFSVDSGDYRSTYKRADGPNPEHSTIATAAYHAGFSDRWFFDQLSIGDPAGPDILDGFKFQFAPDTCGRSEATFNVGEGAFVANLDGPVRAIRSYVGANSGPLTERTDVFYRQRHQIITDLRVHSIGGLMTFHDMSQAAVGANMSYFDSENSPVPVDGNQDAIGSTLPSWRYWNGIGSLWSADRIESSFKDQLLAASSAWYLDSASPGSVQQQCWGDSQALGESGIHSTYTIPNTDPRNGPAEHLRATTTDVMVPTPLLRGAARREPMGPARLAAELDAPLQPGLKRVKLRPH
jgi:hypothetical protein